MKTNKLIAAVMAVAVTGASMPFIGSRLFPSVQAAEALFGDINGDNIIDGRDATMLLTYYAKSSTGYTDSLAKFVVEQGGEATSTDADFGDINGDKIIDGRDATMLLTYYAKTSTGYEGTLEKFVEEQSGGQTTPVSTTAPTPAVTTSFSPTVTAPVTTTATPEVTAFKSFAIKAYAEAGSKYDAMGSSVTVSKADVAAGDVVVPCAVYLNEGANDSEAIAVAVKLVSDSKDVGNITFRSVMPSDDYFAEEKEYTIGADTIKTKRAVTFAGSVSLTGKFLAAGSYEIAADTSQTEATADNAYIGCSWTCNGSSYNFTGMSSSDHPFMVFDVIIPKGTAAGEYKLEYCKYNTDSSGVHYNPTPMIENSGRYTEQLGNLKLEEMTIRIA